MSQSSSTASPLQPLDYTVIVIYFILVIIVGLHASLWAYAKRIYRWLKTKLSAIISTNNRRESSLSDHQYSDVAMQPIPSKDSLYDAAATTIGGDESNNLEGNDDVNRAANNEEEKKKDSKDFFLANGNIGAIAIACSLFASNIGAEHIIGLSSSGASIGLAVGMAELYSPVWILVLGWLFIPFYLKTRVFTLPEFIEKRFDRNSRMYLSVLSLVMYVMTKISVSIYAGVVVFQVLLGWNIWVSAAAVVVATGIYTVLGGLSAVIYTEVLQTGVLVIGALLVYAQGMVQVGGYSKLKEQLPDSMLHLFQPPWHHDFPVTGVFLGMSWTSMWYWCTDQSIVQRALAAKDLANAIRGCILAAFLKFLPFFLMIIPGMIARVLIPQVEKDPNVAYILLIDKLVPVGVKGLIIAAILAALMSSLASIFHSSSTLFTMDLYRVVREYFDRKNLTRQQLLNAESNIESSTEKKFTNETIVELDDDDNSLKIHENNPPPPSSVVYASALNLGELDNSTTEFNTPREDVDSSRRMVHIDKTVAEDLPNRNTEYVIVGKIAGAVVTVVGLGFIPVVQILSKQLYIYTHKVMGYLAAPIAVIFLMGILSKTPNHYGSLFTLILGNTIGLSRLFLEAMFNSKVFDIYKLPDWSRSLVQLFIRSNFLHFSACMALFSIVSLFLVSYITGSSTPEKTENLTLNYSQLWRSVREFYNQQVSWKETVKVHSDHVLNVVLSVVLVFMLCGMYIAFG